MYGFGVILGILIAGGDVFDTSSLLGVSFITLSRIAIFGFFTAVFIQAGTFALNDYCDLKSDIANRRLDRPLVRGELSKGEALFIAVLATALGIICASFLNPVLFLLALIAAVLGILYDLKMKEVLAVSNLYIALTMAIPFIFGGLIVEPERIELVLLILAAIAFLAGFGREVMKDIADIKGDALRDIKSIARVYGVEKAKRVVVFSYSLAVVLSMIPVFSVNTSYFFNPAYLLPVIAADALFVHTSFKLKPFRKRFNPKTVPFEREDINYSTLRKETLLAIGIGLLAFVSGALLQFNLG